MNKGIKFVLYSIGFLVLIYLILLIPIDDSPDLNIPVYEKFEWKKDDYFKLLESEFLKNKSLDCSIEDSVISFRISHINNLLDSSLSNSFNIQSSIYDSVLNGYFILSTVIPVCCNNLSDYLQLGMKIRNVVKEKTIHSDIKKPEFRNRIYTLLYGSRAAIEEVLLQLPPDKSPGFLRANPDESLIPSVKILDIVVRSGDILISRGGAPVSALISRGNDYPGNFSHCAILYVDEKTHTPYIIESHIERGVTISNVKEYLDDKKLRIMVLRLRSDLPELQNDILLPHKSAKYIFEKAGESHIAYDFSLNFEIPDKMFCSEVVYNAYKSQGLKLWEAMTYISDKGTVDWLSSFGVTNFYTHEPADLEYDPRINVVSEWRDRNELLKDHINNAVTDALLDEANNGRKLEYNIFMLPIARIIKLYSVILNLFGKVGTIPEGLSAESALKSESYKIYHSDISSVVNEKVKNFISVNGYTPPFWELYKISKESTAEYFMNN
ncbi:MAG TPA: YiiX/YebB-like N1pC/P60 family cysteine hydrolase [Ignavibacteria bacterium]|nr:YiiX/YebB-like N1pC/P60 family cysteine hydrolase [Ignavibacteria bacterium]